MGKVITVTQQKGGSGKTTLAANLAVGFAAAGCKAAILDTDPQGSLGRWYMTRMERTPDAQRLGFRTASAWGARFEARELAKTHDIVVIDTPPKMGIDGRPAIEAADLVIVPVTPSPVDLWATEPTIELIRECRRPFLIVLNRASSRLKILGETAAVLKSLKAPCCQTIIGNRIVFAEAMRDGRSVMDISATPARAEIGNVIGEIGAHVFEKAVLAA